MESVSKNLHNAPLSKESTSINFRTGRHKRYSQQLPTKYQALTENCTLKAELQENGLFDTNQKKCK
jgi:hypothetical protein